MTIAEASWLKPGDKVRVTWECNLKGKVATVKRVLQGGRYVELHFELEDGNKYDTEATPNGIERWKGGNR